MAEILIDLYKLNDLNSGLGQFTLNFADAIHTAPAPDIRFHCLLNKTDRHLVPKCEQFENPGFTHRYLPFLGKRYALWHSLHQLPSHFPPPGTPWVLTVHDLNFLVEKSPSKSAQYLQRLQKHVDHATCITVISEHTRQVLCSQIDMGTKPLFVVPNGVTLRTYADAQAPKGLSVPRFFLSLGVFKEKKNFHRLISLMKFFPEHHLVLAGNCNTHYGKQVLGMVHQANLIDRIHLTGEVTDQEKFWLYSHCEAFLMPSEAEGFGLPAIEAMLAGKPVVLNRATSLPEVGGNAAQYWDSFQPEHMAAVLDSALQQVSANPVAFSAKMKTHAEQYSWETAAARYLEVYRSVFDLKKKHKQ